MSYIDFVIPFVIGCYLAFSPQSLVKVTTPSYEKKKTTLKKCGLALIGISVLYLIIKIFS